MKLLFDQMLGDLASWCRILGIDSAFFKGESDSQLLALAKKNKQIVVTRDSGLAERCERDGVGCVLVRDGTLEERLAQVLKETGAEATFPEKTRCASCNGELEDAPKESVKDEVEAETFARTDRFWRCEDCRKVFWEGGHWKNIRRIYSDAKRIIDGG